MNKQHVHHILIVDDQENWRNILKTILTGKNRYLKEAGTYTEAETYLNQERFDLVVLDIRLQDEERYNVGGLKLLEVVKFRMPNAKIVVLTGYYPDTVEKAPKSANAFFSKKNFTSHKFKRKIEQLLSDSQ